MTRPGGDVSPSKTNDKPIEHGVVTAADSPAAASTHLSVFDPFRGFLALWVLIGHVAQRCGGTDLANRYAVDNFMFVSGFLMYYIWNEQRKRSLTKKSISNFFIRRFFRIAPLYYVAFSLSLILSFYLSVAFVATFYKTGLPWDPQPWLRGPAPVVTPSPINWWDALAHYSFLFGLFPSTAASSWLPDWSIGLEMQFYLLVPLLVVALRRSAIAIFVVTAICLVIVYVNNKLFGVYLSGDSLLGITYGQPSLISFKLHLFLAGALAALIYIERNTKSVVAAFACLLVIMFPQPKYVGLPIVLVTVMLFSIPLLPKGISSILSARPCTFLGDTSYALYLTHQPILIGVCYLLVQHQWWLDLSTSMRLLTALAIILPITYVLSYLAFLSIERPMIALGRRLTTSRSKPASDVAVTSTHV